MNNAFFFFVFVFFTGVVIENNLVSLKVEFTYSCGINTC